MLLSHLACGKLGSIRCNLATDMPNIYKALMTAAAIRSGLNKDAISSAISDDITTLINIILLSLDPHEVIRCASLLVIIGMEYKGRL